MWSEIFVALGRVPYLRKKLWNRWYDYLARHYRAADWTFMNYGFRPHCGERIELRPEDEPNRSFIQLYHHVVGTVSLSELTVLEVGCGRGGGASFVARYLQPAKMVGLDLSHEAIDLCRRIHSVASLSFQTGEAGKLPFAPESFDAVINVESSHCYPNLANFFSEVNRVLKPGGHFLYADLHDAGNVDTWRATLKGAGLSIVREANITANVLAALDQDNARKADLIRRMVPAFLKAPFMDFAGMRGSKVYKAFRSGSLVYLSFCARKASPD